MKRELSVEKLKTIQKIDWILNSLLKMFFVDCLLFFVFFLFGPRHSSWYFSWSLRNIKSNINLLHGSQQYAPTLYTTVTTISSYTNMTVPITIDAYLWLQVINVNVSSKDLSLCWENETPYCINQLWLWWLLVAL